MSTPRTGAGKDLLAHSVQYVPADADRRITGAKIAEVEAEAVAQRNTELAAKVRALPVGYRDPGLVDRAMVVALIEAES